MATHDKDFELPQASINRILKSKLPDSVSVSKEAKQAFAKAAGIFVLYVTAAANDFCREGKRQTISAQDVLDSMRELDFESFVEPLQKCLDAQRGETENKKKAAKLAKMEKQLAEAEAQGGAAEATTSIVVSTEAAPAESATVEENDATNAEAAASEAATTTAVTDAAAAPEIASLPVVAASHETTLEAATSSSTAAASPAPSTETSTETAMEVDGN